MSLAKTLFSKDRELSSNWNAVAKADWFGKVLTFARAELMEGTTLKPGEMEGAKRFENILLDLANLDAEHAHLPTSGLHHDYDSDTVYRPKPVVPENTTT